MENNDNPPPAPEPAWQQRFFRKLELAHGGSAPWSSCPSCGAPGKTRLNNDAWTPAMYRLMANGGGVTIGGKSFPSAVLICENCGYSRYYNLIVLGVINVDGTLRHD